MIRLTALLFATHRLFWNAGPSTGERVVWAGSVVRFGCGPHGAVSLDADALHWCTAWVDRQDDTGEFEAWVWFAEGTLRRPAG